jgi:hypothetical protein
MDGFAVARPIVPPIDRPDVSSDTDGSAPVDTFKSR